MSRQNAPFDFKSFDKGFITDANPVDFPLGASTEEANFWINEDGSRHRRLGLDPFKVPATHVPEVGEGLGLHGVWYNVGGKANQHFLYIQSGKKVHFFRYNATSLRDEVGHIDVNTNGQNSSAAVIDGELIIVDGGEDIISVRCDNPDANPAKISTEQFRLEIRDMFGVTDKIYKNMGTADEELIDLQDPKHIAYRPLPGVDSNTTGAANLDAHLYNLRNQTFARPRLPKGADGSSPEKIKANRKDPVDMFKSSEFDKRLPSNADNVITYLYPDIEDTTNRTVDRYHELDGLSNSVPNMQSPQGYFIIDALDRRASRIEVWRDLIEREDPVIGDYSITPDAPIEDFNPNLPEDKSISGAKVVVEYGGRLWYAGFEDSTSSQTRLNSYLLYSQISQSRGAVARCYQAGDPTDKVEPEVVATDGGALSIDGAYNIKRLEVLGTTLLVFAANGVWAVSGASGNYFSPTSQRIERLSNKGCISSRSVVVDDHMCMYWSEDGVYSIQYERQGRLIVKSLTRITIQKYINGIVMDAKAGVNGAYDGQLGQAIWVVPPNEKFGDTQVLRYHVKRDAWTRDVVSYNPTNQLNGFIKVPPFSYVAEPTKVVVGGTNVVVGGRQVVLAEPRRDPVQFSTIAVGLYDDSKSERGFWIGSFVREDFLDWGTDDAKAYIVAGWVTGNDLARRKQVPYLTAHFKQTEQFIDPDTGAPSPASSCIFQSQWDWTQTAVSNKWSKPVQIYRLKRYYIPSSYAVPMDGGYGTVVTRNKVRGRGRTVSMKYETEPLKDCQILGWNFQMDSNSNI